MRLYFYLWIKMLIDSIEKIYAQRTIFEVFEVEVFAKLKLP